MQVPDAMFTLAATRNGQLLRVRSPDKLSYYGVKGACIRIAAGHIIAIMAVDRIDSPTTTQINQQANPIN